MRTHLPLQHVHVHGVGGDHQCPNSDTEKMSQESICGSCRSCRPTWRCGFPPLGSLEGIGRETGHDEKQSSFLTMYQVELSNSGHVEAVEVVVSKCWVTVAGVCATPGRGVSVPWSERAR